jgi:hypothetical protein
VRSKAATSQFCDTEPTGASEIPPRRAATNVPSAARSTGTVSAPETIRSAPNAAASRSSLPTPFCGVRIVVSTAGSSARRSASIAAGVSYDLTATIARSGATRSTSSMRRGA